MLQIVEMRVHMDCPGCEKKIRKALSDLEGVHDIIVDRTMQKVTVMGWADQQRVLKKVRKTGRAAEMWAFPFNPEYHSFVNQYNLNFPYHDHKFQNYQPLISSSYSALGLPSSHGSRNHGYNGDGYGYGYYQQPPNSTFISEDAGCMFCDENPHFCSVM